MDSNGTQPTPAPRRRRSAAAQPATPVAQAPDQPAEPPAQPAQPATPVERGDLGVAAATGGGEVVVRSGAALPDATLASLELTQGAIGRLEAEEVHVSFGAVGAARADRLEVQLGSVGAAMANDLAVTQGAAGTVLAGNVTLDGAVVRTLVARRVVVRRPSLVAVLIARQVGGDVRVLLDWRGALVLGIVAGVLARLGTRRR